MCDFEAFFEFFGFVGFLILQSAGGEVAEIMFHNAWHIKHLFIQF